MKIVVIGGSGLIGKKLIPLLRHALAEGRLMGKYQRGAVHPAPPG
jgi:uncharacterized protein YbjT (DUF2867 family)